MLPVERNSGRHHTESSKAVEELKSVRYVGIMVNWASPEL